MLYLLDKSAYELAWRNTDAQRSFQDMTVNGILSTCAIVELEVFFSARNPSHHQQLHEFLRAHCIWLETTDDTMITAVDLQETMLRVGMHRKPIPDLLLAAVALAHDAVVVHHDHDFDDLARATPKLRTRWIVPPR